MSLAASVSSVVSGSAAVLRASAASRSFSLAGIRDETSRPAPKAISPAASGLPWVLALTCAGRRRWRRRRRQGCAEPASPRCVPALPVAECTCAGGVVGCSHDFLLHSEDGVFDLVGLPVDDVGRGDFVRDGVDVGAEAGAGCFDSARMASGFSLIVFPRWI